MEAAAPGLGRLGGTANELDVTYFAAALAGLRNCRGASESAKDFQGLEGEISSDGLAITA